MTFGQIITVGNYKCEEVASALQKCLRRGDIDGALFWATELDLSGYGEYVWKRLRIITSEDCGGPESEPLLVLQVRALYDNWLDQRKKSDTHHAPERLFLVDAILRISRAFKSRVVDEALISYYEGPRPRREIPDFALDRHTARGRALRRDWKHFFEEGALLLQPATEEPYHRFADDVARRAQAIRGDAAGGELSLDA